MHRPPEPEGSSPALRDLPSYDPNDHTQPFVPQPSPPPHGKLWVQILLLALTLATTTLVGAENYAFFTLEYSQIVALMKSELLEAAIRERFSLVNGLWYSLTILGILGCHEMGHYLACLYYNIVATRPYFLPLPPSGFTMTGTLGAFIRVRSRFPDKKALFDCSDISKMRNEYYVNKFTSTEELTEAPGRLNQMVAPRTKAQVEKLRREGGWAP